MMKLLIKSCARQLNLETPVKIRMSLNKAQLIAPVPVAFFRSDKGLRGGLKSRRCDI